MLAAGAQRTAIDHSLRAQLRAVLRQLHRQQGSSTRQFSRKFQSQAHCRAAQEGEQHDQPVGPFNGIFRPQLGERLIGRAGRQQRETFEPLGIDSLGKKSSVVILRDVLTQEKPQAAPASPVEDVDETKASRSLVTESEEPSEQDVQASIEALHPQDTYLSQDAYANLVKSLAQGYSKTQLKTYIKDNPISITEVTAQDDETPRAVMSTWIRGSHDIDKRIPLQAKVPTTAGLNKLAEHIVRNIWSIGQESELQDIGELELRLNPHYFSYFIDRYGENEGWRELFTVGTLAQSIELGFHEPSYIIRITGRQHDAHDAAFAIADELEAAMIMKLPITESQAERCSPDVLEAIAEATQTMIDLEDDLLTIRGASSECYDAKRRLSRRVSPMRRYRDRHYFGLWYAGNVMRPEHIPYQEGAGNNAVAMHRSTILTRSEPELDLASKTRFVEQKVADLQHFSDRRAKTHHSGESTWQADIGYLLSPDDAIPDASKLRFSSRLSAFSDVLAHFRPVVPSGSRRLAMQSSKRLKLRFIPMPFIGTAPDADLQTIEIEFQLLLSPSQPSTLQPAFWSASARPFVQQTMIALPDREVDLRLRRQFTGEHAQLHRSSISNLVREVEMQRFNSLKEALRVQLPQQDIELVLDLPAPQPGSHSNTQRGLYICDKITVLEWHNFAPRADANDTRFDHWPENALLRVQHERDSRQEHASTSIFVHRDDKKESQAGSSLRDIVFGALTVLDLSTTLSRKPQAI